MDSVEYARRVGAKVEAWLREGTTMTWVEMIARASNEVTAEDEADE
jgi:hypothetical protein